MLLQSLLLVTALLGAQAETTFTVEYAGKKYEFRIPDADLEKTPAWAPGQENPPLSARRAIDVATRQVIDFAAQWKELAPPCRDPSRDRQPLDLSGRILEPLRGDGGGQQLSVRISGGCSDERGSRHASSVA
jgi:hypothetical protein